VPPGLVDTAREYSQVFHVYVPIALGVFGAIVLVVVVAVVVYRRRPVERAARWHEHNRAEGAYALVLVLTIAFLLYITFGAEHEVDTVSARERPQLTVDVTAAKWEWHFHYPGYGIDRFSGTVGHEALVVPVGEAIRLRMRSVDVIHAFWVPELRWKHDLTPGSTQEATVTFSRTGSFPGACAEFCGLFHSRMLFDVWVLGRGQFAAWVAAHRGGTRP
jgi:cytochrome c oxidase subunit 2